jgi:signal-transduction protein with cAMP-binding, CBS, and nucleotidyltransferase domain
MEKISPILARKQHHFNSILSGCSLKEALHKMKCENTGYLIVVDNDDRFLGLLTEHEITGKAMLQKRSVEKISVDELMNTNLPVASSDDTVEVCMKLMCQHHVQQIPVFEEHQFRGIISSDDLLREVVSMRNEVFDDYGEEAIF